MFNRFYGSVSIAKYIKMGTNNILCAKECSFQDILAVPAPDGSKVPSPLGICRLQKFLALLACNMIDFSQSFAWALLVYAT
jgi:hypothetical protein